MASLSRQDRALMRQRGAGSRNIAAADFDLDFGLGGKGQERQPSRQQGPTSDKVENIGFDLSLPGSARTLRSTSTKTPQSIVGQSLHTPGRRSPGTSSVRSARQSYGRTQHSPVRISQALEFRPEGDRHHPKRTRLSSTVGTPGAANTDRRQSKRFRRSNTFAIAEDDDNGGGRPETFQNLDGHAISQRQNSPLFFSDEAHNKENELVSADQRRQRSRKLFGNADFPQRRKESYPSTRSTPKSVAPEPLIEEVEDVEERGPHEQTGSKDLGNMTQSSPTDNPVTVLDHAGHSNPKRRKKRKSVILVRKRKRSSGPDRALFGQGQAPSRSLASSQSEMDAHAPSSSRSASQTRHRSSPSMHPRYPLEPEEDGDETYIQESSPGPPTPAPANKAGKATHRRTSAHQRSGLSNKKGSNPTFPFLTHRLANLTRLPTIHEASEGEDHFENAPDVPSGVANDHTQPNVVDVLSQICREAIEQLAECMAVDVAPSQRAALSSKQAALEAFGRDLDDELFELSEAVENRIMLEARVRKSKRDKASLQTEWIELRKDRERIALECDAVRRRHWESEDEARERWCLSEAARRLEVELQSDDQSGRGGLDFLLRSVVGNVSSASEEGGLLDRVKSFNTQLESIALSLEGQRGHSLD